MPVIRLITFDVTGTILTFRKPVFQQYVEHAKKFGIQADPRQISSQFKIAWKQMSASDGNFGQSTGIGWREWWERIVIGSFSNEIKTDADHKKVQQLANHLIDHFTTSKAWTPVEQSKYVLQSLKNNGHSLGVISNFDPRLHTILKELELAHLFSFIVTSYEAGWEKPDKRIFQEALRLGKITNPLHALHIGNDLVNDFEGAQKVGMHAIIISEDKVVNYPTTVNKLVDVLECVNKLEK